MFKIILVDDDGTFLEGFHSLVEWEKYGLEVVGTFLDGKYALKYIENNRVDAVITDISMPKLSGLELARIINESYPDIKVVFFSAFCTFQYVNEAIKYDVVGYISKPISIEQLEEALKKLCTKLNEKKGDVIAEIVDSNVIEKREDIFFRWLSNNEMHSGTLKEELGKANIPYQAVHSKCALAIFDLDGMDEHTNSKWKYEKKNFYNAITKVVCVDTIEFYTVQLSLSDRRLAVLYISRQNDTLLKNCANMAKENLEEMFGLKVVNTEILSFDSMVEFKKAYKASRKPSLKYLLRMIERKKDEESIIRIEEYVDEHFADNIDLESAAKYCHFSARRFSEFFKKIKGEKFVDYLNRIRIEKAKEMLAAGEKDIEEICNGVGYGSRRYFYKQFSLYTGETPAQYRKKMLGGKR